MPYFKNNKINLLFIHIPKTGGSSLEKYFSVKYNIPLNRKSLMSTENISNIMDFIDKPEINSSLQHLTYNSIMKYKDFFKIDAVNNFEIITVVRNPYNKIVSDLFYFKKINIDSSKEEAYEKIKEYLKDNYDNHAIPQYKFIINDAGELIDNIKILHTETLNCDMISLGYKDFNIKMNMNPVNVNYDDYLNKDSINLINDIYGKDFQILNYIKK
jgi:hypothetical protein